MKLLWFLASLVLLSASGVVYGEPSWSQLPVLARTGQFDQVLSALESYASRDTSPLVCSLLSDLQAQRRHRQEQREAQQKALAAALADSESLLRAGQVDRALLSALEASSLSEDPRVMVDLEQIRRLVAESEGQAAAAEAAHDWLEALAIYRALYLLYDDQEHYKPQMDQAQRRARLLRLYAPQQFKELVRQRKERVAAAETQPSDATTQVGVSGETLQPPAEAELELDDETWETLLDGVDLDMFRQALLRSSYRHVTSPGYEPMVEAAVQALQTLAQTPELAESLPTLSDPQALQAFQAGLDDILRQVQAERLKMDYAEALALVDKVENLNAQTLKLPRRVLAFEMTDGMMSRLDDFSSVIWPHDMEQFSRNTQGKFYGIGIEITRRDGRLMVISPLLDTPAYRAGLKAGDFIVEVDGKDTASWSLDKAVRQITGPKGSTVRLGVERVGSETPLKFSIKRAEIEIQSIRGWQRRPDDSWDYFIDPTLGVGYVQLSSFLPQSADELDRALNQMMQKKGRLSALIIDLRFNPGGLLSSAIDIVDRFVDSGPIVSTVGAHGEVTHEFRARPDRTQPGLPMIVLTNRGSASASEIVSGALQDYGRALVVGERTFGKGSVQDLFGIADGKAFLKLTTQYYRLPNGRIIHRLPGAKTWGVDPDLVVKMTDKQVVDAIDFRRQIDMSRDAAPTTQPAPTAADILAKGLDPQLEAALLVLKTQLVAGQIAVAHAEAAQPAVAASR